MVSHSVPSLMLVVVLGLAPFSASPAAAQVQSESFEERLYFPTGDASVAKPLRLSIPAGSSKAVVEIIRS